MPLGSAIAKPIRFGLAGLLGGLLGALVLGEVAWHFLKPPPPPKLPAKVYVSVSPSLELYQGDKNKFTLQIARERCDGAVTVSLQNLPPGIEVTPATLAAGETSKASDLHANGAAPGKYVATVKAETSADGVPITGSTTMDVIIKERPRPKADIVFVLDVTGSMQNQIDGIAESIVQFTDSLHQAKIDVRFGMVAFRDLEFNYPPEIFEFKGSNFTDDVSEFARRVKQLRADGPRNTDYPESSLEAIVDATKFDFRKNTQRIVLLITDAPPKVRRVSIETASQALHQSNIEQMHIICRSEDRSVYENVRQKITGRFFNLFTVARSPQLFQRELIPTLSRVIIEATIAKQAEAIVVPAQPPPAIERGVQSSEAFEEGSGSKLALAVSIWTGLIAALVCLALATMQSLYLGKWPSLKVALLAAGGGFLSGATGGAAGQGLFALGQGNTTLNYVFQTIGWTLLGGLVGLGLGFVIPNLAKKWGLAGGALGGALGAVAYLAASSLGSDLIGRVVGAMILGFMIGLMVALVEAVFRQAWLEVWNRSEMVRVNLGPEPVKIGGDSRQCTVWARGAKPIELRYWVRDGKVVCKEAEVHQETVVANGSERTVGALRLVVRQGSVPAGTVVAPSMAIRPPPPPPKAVSRMTAPTVPPTKPVISTPPVPGGKPVVATPPSPSPTATTTKGIASASAMPMPASPPKNVIKPPPPPPPPPLRLKKP